MIKKVPGSEVKPASHKSNIGRHDEHGREILDGRPMAPPVGYKRTPSLAEQIREMVRSEKLAQLMQEQGVETFAEADDFNVGDDFDPSSPYEEYFEPTPLEELIRRHEEAQAAPQPPPTEPGGTGGVSPPVPSNAPGGPPAASPAPSGGTPQP